MAEREGKEAALTQLHAARNTTLVSLRKLFAAAREIVSFSHKPVIVYTTIDGVTPCLGFLVDSVDDALTISEDDIKSFKNDTGIQFMGDLNLPKMISGLITKDNVNSLLIDPSLIKNPLPEQTVA
jgi:chemotaxis signal transduction protein